MFVQLYLPILAGFLSCVASLPTDLVSNSVQERDTGKGYLSFPFDVVRTNFSVSSTGGIQRSRRGDIGSPIDNHQYIYSISLLIGSNQQPVTVAVDTGSSDLWVVDVNADCENRYNCKTEGVYDPSQSSTSKKLDEQFGITYVDKSSISGYYYLDDVTLPQGPTIKQVQFADADKVSTPVGIMGIGLNTSEEPYFSGQTTTMYADFPWALKEQGFIAKAAYSLFLNSPDATQGTLLFGGIDNAKIDGSLVELPGVLSNRLAIQGDSVTVDGTTHNIGQDIVLDSGYSFTRLPQAAADAIANALSGGQKDSQGYTIDCTQPDKTFTFSLGNGAQTVKVPYSSFVRPGGQPGGRCPITLSYSTDHDFNNIPTFGDDVLRNLYVVYDLEGNKMSIGQAKYTMDSDITPIQ